MPTRAPTRHQTRLCAYFYSYGKQCGTRTFPFLVLSLLFIAFYSYTFIFHSVNSITPSTTTNHVDARFWEFSPHLQPENATLSSVPGLIVQQVRITNDKRSVDSTLLNHARNIERALTSHSVTVDGKLSSLASICKLHYGQCMIHSPTHYWNDKDHQEMMDSSMMDIINTRAGSVSETTGLSMHPLSVFGNVTLDKHGRFRSADSIMITVFLQQQSSSPTYMAYSKRVWDALWQSVSTQMHIESLPVDGGDHHHHQESDAAAAEAWQTQFHMHPQLLNYKFKILILDHAYLYLGTFILVCFIASGLFTGYAHHVRSQFAHGFAVMFTVVASYTTTMGILDSFDMKLSIAPLYLLLVVPTMASIENMLLLTEAVLSAGCDMQIKEKIGRGLESVGLPMTLTLLAEQVILAISTAMDVPLINEFCLFARIALLVGYALDMTFTLAFLAVNVKCVELTDLDDRQTSKRLRELAKFGMDEDQADDFCPVQEPADDNVPKSCAECKQFKTHRTYNALMLCLIILSLTLLRPSIQYATPMADMNMELRSVSHRFWNMVNPLHRRMALQVNPPQLVIYAPTAIDGYLHAQRIEEHYRTKTSLDNMHLIQSTAAAPMMQQQQQQQPRQPSRFRKAVFTVIQQAIEFLMQINLPSVLLTLVLVGILMWLNPSSHERWLQPMWRFLIDDVLDMIRIKVVRIVSWSDNYDKDGVHRGAISAQKQFNQQQLEHNIKDVTIKTLSGRHIADIRRLAINAKHGTVVSCGQDGRIIMWDADHAEWMARLDRMRKTHGEIMEADLNPKYWRTGDNRRLVRNNASTTTNDLQSTLLQSARCIKMDQGNKWIAAGFDDGIIRVWRITTGTLLRELRVETRMPVTIEEQQDPTALMTLRHRKAANNNESLIRNTRRTVTDRVMAVQFIGAVTEYCHPLVAEVAAKQRVKNAYDDSSQNFLVSVHKSGMMREWDILSGECIQSFPSGHQRDVTVLHVVECKPPHRKLGITWVFTASKDGLIKCWERRLVKQQQQQQHNMDEQLDQDNNTSTTTWTCVYTIEGHYGHAITSLATEIPVGGMGVLVSGSSDGAVKVWDFESGDAVCTLSAGGVQRKKPEIHAGGPLLKFSKFNHAEDVYYGSENLYRLDEHDNDKSADHHGPITQVVVTRYCEVENGPGICRGCDTCFGNGFGIASCSMDENVHVWRLERADGKHEGSCTLCSKDYHQKRRKPRQEETTSTTTVNDFKSTRRRNGGSGGNSSITTTTTGRRVYGPPMTSASMTQHESTTTSADGLVDIEQLGGETNIALTPRFLGKIDQLAGRGLVFCNNMVLAGVRKKRRGDWEAWFASLKYYDEGCQDDITIPVEAFDLDTTHKKQANFTQNAPSSSSGVIQDRGLWNDVKRWLFGDEAAVKRQRQHQSWEPENSSDDDESYDEASELLPFSTVRHAVPLDGSGIACDYGNFIKLVYLDDQCHKRSQRMDESIVSKKGCKCGDKCAGSSACCGGSNCSSGGGRDKKQCCGGTSSSKRAVRRQRNQNTAAISKNLCNVSECSTANCSRASDCPVAATSSSSSSKTRNVYRWS